MSRRRAALHEGLPSLAAPETLARVRAILVVEDEPGIARLVEDYLEAAGFTVLLASTAGDAIAQARASAPALVVLDLGLPDRDGLDVTRELRHFTDVPIVMLTARADESDRIVGLDLGLTTTS